MEPATKITQLSQLIVTARNELAVKQTAKGQNMDFVERYTSHTNELYVMAVALRYDRETVEFAIRKSPWCDASIEKLLEQAGSYPFDKYRFMFANMYWAYIKLSKNCIDKNAPSWVELETLVKAFLERYSS